MKGKISSLFLIFILMIAIKPTLAIPRDIEIRVGLSINEREATFFSNSPMTALEGAKTLAKEKELRVTVMGGIGKVNKSTFENKLTIIPSKGNLIYYNGRPYRGRFEIILKGNSFNVINVLSVEEYLYGVLKKEVPPSWPFEALKAQAVVSRTYALSNIGRHSLQGFDLCAGIHCQGYGGVSSEDPILNKAVDATRGEVLTYNGSLAKVFYHSDSGGYIASAKSVWGEDIPYLKEKREDFYNDCDSPHRHWRLELPSSKLTEILCENGFGIGKIKDIVITKRDAFSFRALTLRIIGTEGSINLPATRLREMIGYSILRSTAFDISKREPSSKGKPKEESPPPPQMSREEKWARARNINVRELLAKGYTYDDIILILAEAYGIIRRDVAPEGEKPKEETLFPVKEGEIVFVFEGKGWGHGVGMSQWGAKTLAEKGKSYIEILQFYFPETKLERRW